MNGIAASQRHDTLPDERKYVPPEGLDVAGPRFT